jgi:hypothetical protein
MDGRNLDEINPWGAILAAAAYTIRNTYHTILNATPEN